MDFFSIGVFHSTESQFFQQLIDHRIDMFCDIRMRRSVRGSHYAFVNSTRLQERLAELNIRYLHILALAPTEYIRAIQQSADLIHGASNTNRVSLDAKFIAAYNTDIVAHFDWDTFLNKLSEMNAKRIAFFCVEEHAQACHRSLVLQHLSQVTNTAVHHI
jgi:uncharacterized protein (DUF488 family)